MNRMYDMVFLFFVSQCFPGCLTIQIRTVLCILIVLLIYAVAQACVVSLKGRLKRCGCSTGSDVGPRRGRRFEVKRDEKRL